MPELVDAYIYIYVYVYLYTYVLVSHPQTRRSKELKKCDVNMAHALKRML